MGFTSICLVVKCHIVVPCEIKAVKGHVDGQDSNLSISGKLMVKILNVVMLSVPGDCESLGLRLALVTFSKQLQKATTRHIGVTPHPPLSLDQLVT